MQALRFAQPRWERWRDWLLRVPAEEPAPVVLGARRLFVLPTRAGLLYALALVVLLIGAINYSLALGHALVFLLAGLGVVTILHTYRNLLGVRLQVGAAPPVFAGGSAQFPILLGAADARARRRLFLALAAGEAVGVDLPPAGSARAVLAWPAPRRGWLKLPRVSIATTWPLGLVRCWAYARPQARCLVYPAPAASAPPAPTLAGMQGGRWPRDDGDEDFAGLRRHQPGDPLHHIAWKSVARLDASAPLLTKQFAGSAAPALWFDWRDLPASLDDETRLSILTRWLLDAENAGLAYGLRLPAREIGQGHGAQHLHTCLAALALYGETA